MSDNPSTVEVVDLTTICSTFPARPEPELSRENMVSTLDGLLKSNTELIVVEGEEGIGKTTLLAQFARTYNQQTFSAFVTNSSRYAWDSAMIARNLHEQIQFALGHIPFQKHADADIQSLLRGSIADLQKKANWEKKKYYFVIDGLEEIPNEERSAVAQIIELLPIGLSTFRFLLSGLTEILEPFRKGRVTLKPWALPTFSLDETIKYFSSVTIVRDHYETIYKFSNKGFPGRLASIMRLCTSTDMSPDDVLANLPDHAPDLLEREWQTAEEAPAEMQIALAALCFDTRPHTVNSLASLCGLDADKLQGFLEQCTFIQWGSTVAKPLTFVSYFKRFAAKKLAKQRKAVFQKGIELLMAKPESSDALNHLPYYLHESGEYARLLEYLSGEHIGKLIDCTRSWIPLHQKVDLGISTARTMNRGDDLMRFGLQRAAVTDLESCEQRRSEIQAYVALGDLNAAYSVAQTAIAQEDRLHILAIIASAKRKKGMLVEPELKEQVCQLYSQIDKKGLGSRGVEIALDLLNCQPELAIDLVRTSQEAIGSHASDIGLANLSLRTILDRTPEKESGESCAKVRAELRDPGIQKFVDTLSMLWGEFSATEVLAMVNQWEKPADQIYVMRIWTRTNRQRPDAYMIVDHALNTIIKTTEFSPNAQIYRELAMPMPYVESKTDAKGLVDRFDGIKAIIASVGPTEEYIWLQLLLGGAEYSYARDAAINRFTDIYFSIADIKELATKTACLARLAGMLQRVDPTREEAAIRELHSTAASDLELALRELLEETADHYHAVEPALQTLTQSAPDRAFDLANSLNTEPRRDRARTKIIKSLVGRDPQRIKPEFVLKVLAAVHYPSNYNEAILELIKGLRVNAKEVGHLIPILQQLADDSKKMSCPESRCEFLLNLHAICTAHPDRLPSGYLELLRNELKLSWSQFDGTCDRVDMGFRIVAEMGQGVSEFARSVLLEVQQLRNEMVLDNQRSSDTYTTCCRLAIRAFSGLIKKRIYGPTELEQLSELIEKIPSAVVRALAWTDVALRLYLDGAEVDCKEVVLKHVKAAIQKIPPDAKEQRARAVIWAAPALFKGHSGTAEEVIEGLAQNDKDSAYREICNFLLDRENPFEPYDGNIANRDFLPVETVWDICRLLEKVQADHTVYVLIEKLVKNLEAKKNRNLYSREQLADITSRLKRLPLRFPTANYIQHEGYRILAEAQIARFEKASSGTWDDLIARAKNLPNHSDQAFVLIVLAGAMPLTAKTGIKKRALLVDAKNKIQSLSAVRDRIDRYETLAKHALDSDPQMSRDALRDAMRGSITLESEDVASTRKRLVDTAYRIDPNFAATLASGLDDDPARILKRHEIKEQINTLKLRDSLQVGDEKPLAENIKNPEKMAEAAWMALKRLNSGKFRAIDSERTRSYVQEASRFRLAQAYPIFSLVIESEVRRYKDTSNASAYIKPLFKACVIGAELAFRISAKMRSVESTHLSNLNAIGAEAGSLIKGGEREKGLERIRTWAREEARDFINLCDPYFGPDDLDLVHLIRMENPDIPIAILTSRMHQKGQAVQLPYDEAYQRHWRFNISESDPGEVRVVIVGSKDTGVIPIHDRWLLSASSGLRLGSSINSLGIAKASEVSKIAETDLAGIKSLVQKFLGGVVKMETGEKLLSSSFYLAS